MSVVQKDNRIQDEKAAKYALPYYNVITYSTLRSLPQANMLSYKFILSLEQTPNISDDLRLR